MVIAVGSGSRHVYGGRLHYDKNGVRSTFSKDIEGIVNGSALLAQWLDPSASSVSQTDVTHVTSTPKHVFVAALGGWVACATGPIPEPRNRLIARSETKYDRS